MTDIAALARTLDDAALHAHSTKQLSDEVELTLDEGYDVQAASIARRLARGEKRVGVKMGFTSRAKMVQMGIDDMIWGRLTDGMIVEDGDTISLADYVHPRIEPEVAFLLSRRLEWPVTTAEAISAIEAVAPAMEIIDSRYRDFKFSLSDVVADNASSSGFIIGAWQSAGVDLANLGVIMEINGRPRQIGSTAAILGHPARALVSAARLSTEAGEPLEAGWIVMAGGATAAEALSAGDHVRETVQNLGTCAVTVAA